MAEGMACETRTVRSAEQSTAAAKQAQRCGQYSAKVGVLGSAIALPNLFFMMRKGPEEV